MFGLWFSIIGLIFGILSSLKAREKNRASREWFILGFVFSFIAYAVIKLLPVVGHNSENSSRVDSEDDLLYYNI